MAGIDPAALAEHNRLITEIINYESDYILMIKMTDERHLNFTNRHNNLLFNHRTKYNDNNNNNNQNYRCRDCCCRCRCCRRKIFYITNNDCCPMPDSICDRCIMPIMWNMLSTPTNRRYFKFKQFKYS